MSATVQPSAYQLPSLLPFHTSVPHSCRVTAHRQDFPTALGKPNAVLSGLCQSCPDKGISLSALLLVSSPRYISGCGYGCGVHQWVWGTSVGVGYNSGCGVHHLTPLNRPSTQVQRNNRPPHLLRHQAARLERRHRGEAGGFECHPAGQGATGHRQHGACHGDGRRSFGRGRCEGALMCVWGMTVRRRVCRTSRQWHPAGKVT